MKCMSSLIPEISWDLLTQLFLFLEVELPLQRVSSSMSLTAIHNEQINIVGRLSFSFLKYL